MGSLRDELAATAAARSAELDAVAVEEADRILPSVIEHLRCTAAAGGTHRLIALRDYCGAATSHRLLLRLVHLLRAQGLTADIGGGPDLVVGVSWAEVPRG